MTNFRERGRSRFAGGRFSDPLAGPTIVNSRVNDRVSLVPQYLLLDSADFPRRVAVGSHGENVKCMGVERILATCPIDYTARFGLGVVSRDTNIIVGNEMVC